jgi:hypothetical protein
MDIKEIKAKKKILEASIKALVESFMEETGLLPSNVFIHFSTTLVHPHGKAPEPFIDACEVRIEL